MLAASAILSDPPGVWHAALGSPLSIRLIVLAAALALVAAVILRAMVRLRRTQAMGRGGPGLVLDAPPGNESGVATIEFALLTPILLFVGLALTQTTLLMGGNLFVHYAAFAAARSAIVQVPAERPGEPPNTYVADPAGLKHRAIRRSAVLALVPVAGRGEEAAGGLMTDRIVRGFASFYEGYGRTPPPWIEGQLAQRLRYAAEHTSIQLLDPRTNNGEWFDRFQMIGDGEIVRFGLRDPIGVRVTHRLNLPVPYVNRVFADGTHGGGEGEGGAGRYMNITARMVLQNAGLRDDMPPRPRLWRIP